MCAIVCDSLEEIQNRTGLVLLDYFQDAFVFFNITFHWGLGVSPLRRATLQSSVCVCPEHKVEKKFVDIGM